jgi:hypothetical protein
VRCTPAAAASLETEGKLDRGTPLLGIAVISACWSLLGVLRGDGTNSMSPGQFLPLLLLYLLQQYHRKAPITSGGGRIDDRRGCFLFFFLPPSFSFSSSSNL